MVAEPEIFMAIGELMGQDDEQDGGKDEPGADEDERQETGGNVYEQRRI